jgi:L-lactate dehydrogenase complex protein LldE
MRIGLFIPCYIDQFYPQVGVATLELLEKLGLDVHYPLQQTCCGQPMANSGFELDALNTYQLFVQIFNPYDYIVAPSGSCIYHVRHHYDIMEQTEEVVHVRNKTYELCEFLVKILEVKKVNAFFPYKVGLHQSCHGLRGLHLGKSSEIMDGDYSLVKQLLDSVKGLQFVDLQRVDECCGFGGTFAVVEEAVSVKMGSDRVKDHLEHGAQVITATDMSCLMHMEGIVRRQKLPLQIRHVAEILNSRA